MVSAIEWFHCIAKVHAFDKVEMGLPQNTGCLKTHGRTYVEMYWKPLN